MKSVTGHELPSVIRTMGDVIEAIDDGPHIRVRSAKLVTNFLKRPSTGAVALEAGWAVVSGSYQCVQEDCVVQRAVRPRELLLPGPKLSPSLPC